MERAFEIPGGGGATASLAGLLADKMLTGDVVDMMVEHLALRLRSDHAASETYVIETLSLWIVSNHSGKAETSKV